MRQKVNKLDPKLEIPASEHWIYKKPYVLTSLMRGIEDVKAGRIKDRGSFAKYVEDDEEESE